MMKLNNFARSYASRRNEIEGEIDEMWDHVVSGKKERLELSDIIQVTIQILEKKSRL